MTVNDELEEMWGVGGPNVAFNNGIFQRLIGQTEETMKNSSENNRFPCLNSNPESPEHKAEMLTNTMRLSMTYHVKKNFRTHQNI